MLLINNYQKKHQKLSFVRRNCKGENSIFHFSFQKSYWMDFFFLLLLFTSEPNFLIGNNKTKK